MTDRRSQACLIGLTAEIFFLGWMSQHGDFLQFGEATKFTLLGLAAGVCYWLAVHHFVRLSLTPSQQAWLFWGSALALRLAILPVLAGDDLWRYRWEGKIQLHGFNPYHLAPDSPILASLRDSDWPKINHRDYPAIYPPLAEIIFAALAACRLPVLGYKLLFGLADLGVVAILRSLLVRQGSARAVAAWYAWNPLAVYVSAGAAHFDSLMVLPLLGAVLLLDRCTASLRADGRAPAPALHLAGASAFLLGVATAIKITPAVLLPVWALAVGWRRAMLVLPVFGAAFLVPACHYGFPGIPVFAGLRGFALGFRVNDAFWWLPDAIRQTNPAAQVNGLEASSALLVCGGLAWWFRQDWRRGILWVLGAALLLSPALHAWYVIWLLPLAAWRGPAARPWFVLSLSLFGYFLLWDVNHQSGRPWMEPPWLRLAIYLPPMIALGWQCFRPALADMADASRPQAW